MPRLGVGLGLGLRQAVSGGGGFVGLLDDYPNAAAAYSVRKLRSAYTGSAIRVRRSSDNAEQDIGFTANQLDTTALTSFCGANNGFVTTWYDQSGNARNATQTTAVDQPQIVSAGSVILTNSKPSILLNGVNQFLQLTTLVPSSNQSIFGVGKRNLVNKTMSFLSNDIGGTNAGLLYFTDNNIYYLGNVMYMSTNTSNTSLNLQLVNGYVVSGIVTSIYRNANLLSTSTVSNPNTQVYSHIGKYSTLYSNCNFSEIIYYESNQFANNSGIQTNINNFYSIY